MKKFALFSIVLGLFLSLEGCFFVAGAAAGAAAIAVVYDHRTLQNTLEDTELANKVRDKVRSFPL